MRIKRDIPAYVEEGEAQIVKSCSVGEEQTITSALLSASACWSSAGVVLVGLMAIGSSLIAMVLAGEIDIGWDISESCRRDCGRLGNLDVSLGEEGSLAIKVGES